jgi:hypothetical protein
MASVAGCTCPDACRCRARRSRTPLRGTCSPAARHSRWLAAGEPGTLTSFLRRLPSSPRSRALARHQLLQPLILGRAASAAERRLRQLWIVCSLIRFRLATANTNSRSASRRIATISPSVKRALRIAPSESRASLSRNHWSEIPGQVSGNQPAAAG